MSSIDLLVHSQRLSLKYRHNKHKPTAARNDSPTKQKSVQNNNMAEGYGGENVEILYSRHGTGLEQGKKSCDRAQWDFSRFQNVPLSALGCAVRRQIASYLNVRSSLVTSKGRRVTPDYLGLAELVGFDHSQIVKLRSESSPTEALLHQCNATVGKLCEAILELERMDVLDCTWSLIGRDVSAWISKNQLKRQLSREMQPSRTTDIFQPGDIGDDRTDHGVDEFDFMVVGDRDDKKMHFDAFVCYAPEDIEFVKQMAINLENPPYNCQLCIQDRDILPGSFKHPMAAKLIEDRCKRMLVVISPDYLKSPSCDFQTKFAQAISEDARCKRIIPILLEACDIPTILRPLTLCDFTRERVEKWSWKRVARALENVPTDLSFSNDFSSPLALNDIYLSLSDCPIPWSETKCRSSVASPGSLTSSLSSSLSSDSSASFAQEQVASASKSQSQGTSSAFSGIFRSSEGRRSPSLMPTDHSETPADSSDVLERLLGSDNTSQYDDSAWTVIKPDEVNYIRRRRSPGLRLTANTECVYDVYADKVTLWPIRTTASPEEGWPWDH